MKNNKPHFLLVHGAWHGGWVWKEMADLLRYQGLQCILSNSNWLGRKKTSNFF